MENDHTSGQIIATSHDLGPQKVAEKREIPFISGKPRLVKYYNLARYMDVSENSGTPKWMVKIMENPIKMDDLGGPPLFLETPTCVRGGSLKYSQHFGSTLDHFERFAISIPGLKTHHG